MSSRLSVLARLRKPKGRPARRLRPQEPDRLERFRYRPSFELLEDRTTPALTYVSLGDLGFAADFSVAGTVYSAQATAAPNIQLGYKAVDGTLATFTPAYLIQGDVSFDLAASPLTFTVGQFGQTNFCSTFTVGSPAQHPVLWSTLTPTIFNANDFANDGMNFGAPYLLKLGQYLNFKLESLGLATLPGPGGTTLYGPKLQGDLMFGQLGTDPQNPQPVLELQVDGTNFLTYTNAGFACTGVGAQLNANFTVANVNFQGSLGAGVGGLDGSGLSTTVSIWGSATVSFTSSAAAQNAPPPAGTASNSQKTSFSVLFGDSNSPGITLNLGASPTVAAISGGIAGSFSLEGLQASVPANQPLNFTYVAQTADNPEEYEVSGTIRLQLTNALIFSVGMSEPLIISNGSWQFNSLEFSVGKIDLGGGWRLEDLGFEFAVVTNPNTGATGYEWGGECKVVSPMKNSLGGELAFTIYDGGGVVLDTIGVKWVAGEGEGRLKLLGTGFYIQELAGELKNLNQLANLQIGGDVAIGWGENVKIGGKDYSMMVVNASILVTSSELVLDGSAYFGAKFKLDQDGKVIRDANGQAEVDTLIGSGNVNLTYDWANELGSVSADVSLMDGTFTGQIGFSINSQLQILVDGYLRLNVPNGVPLIGGEKLASASFAFDWNGPTNNGFVAGWLDFFGQEVGISYNIADFAGGSSGWHFFGSNTIATAEAEIANGAAQASEKYAYAQIFAVPAGATGAIFSVNLPTLGGDQDLAIIPVNWVGEPINRLTAASATATANGAVFSNYPQNGQNNWLTFTVGPNGDLVVQLAGSPTNTATTLPGAGNGSVYYKVILNSSVNYSSAPTWTAAYTYTQPSVTIGTALPATIDDPLTPIQITGVVDQAFAAQTTVSLYAQPVFNGAPVAQAILIKTIPYNVHGMTINWENGSFFPGQYRLFARLNTNYAGVGAPTSGLYAPNAPVQSAYTTVTAVSPPLKGTVTNQNGTGLAGQVVWLDGNGSGVFDAPTYDPITGAQNGGDLTTSTDGFGNYAFYYADYRNDPFAAGVTYTVGLATLPPGYSLAGGQANPQTFSYPGQPITKNFNLLQSPTISGTVASGIATDLNGSSTPIDLLPPLSGWLVFLDLNANGLPDANEPQTRTDNNGNYQFLNLNGSSSYFVTVQNQPGYQIRNPTGTVTLAGPYIKVVMANDADGLAYGVNFIFTRQDTVSGTATYYPFVNGAYSSTPVPLPNAAVQGIFGPATFTTQTNGQGQYSFANQYPGQNYTLSMPYGVPGYRLMSPGTFNLNFAMNPANLPNFAAPIAMRNNGGDGRPAASFLIGDFDSNGALDFTWVAPGHQTLYTQYGQRNSGIYNSIDSSVNGVWKDINFNRIAALGDYYGDGGQYLAIVDDAGDIFIMQAKPTGFAAGWETILTLDNHANVQPIDFKTGDFDGDGRPDFALAVSSNSNSATINLYLSADIGSVKPAQNSKATLPNPSFSYDVQATNAAQGQLAIAPIMYNTQNAVIFSQGGNTPIMAYCNTADNNTYWRTTIPGPWGPGAVGIGDINNDTYADAVWGWFGGGSQASASLSYSLGALTYQTPDFGPLALPTPLQPLQSLPNLLVQDFNGDGLSDILYVTSNYNPQSRSVQGSNPPASSIGVFLNQPSAFAANPAAGYFGSAPSLFSTIGSQANAPQASQLLPYDVNGDGLMDLVMADWANGQFVVFLNASTYTAGQITGTTSPTADSTGNNFVFAQNPGQGAAAALQAGPANRGYIMGRVFDDRDGDGVMDPAEQGRAGVTVYLDKNKNGRLDRGEARTVTNVVGLYGFAGLKAGKHRVAVLSEPDRKQTTASGRQTVAVASGGGAGDVNFGSVVARNLTVAAGPGAHDWHLYRNGDRLELLDQATGRLHFSELLKDVASVSIRGADAAPDRFFIDYAKGGSFAVPGGLTLAGGKGSGDRVFLQGMAGAEKVFVSPKRARFGPNAISWSGIETVFLESSPGAAAQVLPLRLARSG